MVRLPRTSCRFPSRPAGYRFGRSERAWAGIEPVTSGYWDGQWVFGGRHVANSARPSPTAQWRLDPQLTAFLTSAAILFSSAVVNFVNAKEVGHMAPSSRFAASWKPNVEYLDLY